MIKTPLSTVIGGAFWTPEATVINGAKLSFGIVMEKLFSNSEQGVAYDPNDLSTMWQDQAKLLPVTGEGQPVWHILDKSGNNNHAFATSSATRPILRKNATTGAYYLEFDGSDDFLQTNNINFTSTDKITVFAGGRKLSDAAAGMITELSTIANTNNGSFFLIAPNNSNGNNIGVQARGTVTQAVTAALVAPANFVSTARINIGGDSLNLRLNGTQVASNVGDQGTGNYGNYPLYIGRRGGTSLPFKGHIYGLIGVGRLSTDNETAAIEKEFAKRTGVAI